MLCDVRNLPVLFVSQIVIILYVSSYYNIPFDWLASGAWKLFINNLLIRIMGPQHYHLLVSLVNISVLFNLLKYFHPSVIEYSCGHSFILFCFFFFVCLLIYLFFYFILFFFFLLFHRNLSITNMKIIKRIKKHWRILCALILIMRNRFQVLIADTLVLLYVCFWDIIKSSVSLKIPSSARNLLE